MFSNGLCGNFLLRCVILSRSKYLLDKIYAVSQKFKKIHKEALKVHLYFYDSWILACEGIVFLGGEHVKVATAL